MDPRAAFAANFCFSAGWQATSRQATLERPRLSELSFKLLLEVKGQGMCLQKSLCKAGLRC